jgi:hypothetical protein
MTAAALVCYAMAVICDRLQRRCKKKSCSAVLRGLCISYDRLGTKDYAE